MTRLAILADIHGNLPALEAVQRDLAQFDVDHVIVAGDVINWGPWSAQVVDRVLAAGWAVIRGNNEFYLLDAETPRAPPAWNDRQTYSMLGWLRRQLNRRRRTLIAAWPDSLSLRFPDAPPVRVVHGSPRSNAQGLFPAFSEDQAVAALEGVDENTVIAAHTHLPMARSIGRWQVLNPGTVGVPLDGQHCSSYMLLDGDAEGWRATFRRLPLDPAPVLAEFERQGFAQACGITGRLVMEEFASARLAVLPFMAWRRACRPGEPLSDALLDAFAAIDRWAYTPAEYHVNR
jgi:predicted phosphodiesterase